ncbi:DNA-binding transcription factor [Lithospermum erythrorhizon]|uniref:DNA-binding transcription factor n=1 Tax=Lithospermum erythrorhizon TaxID=34254 RepID=A0AAV3P100_LITER
MASTMITSGTRSISSRNKKRKKTNKPNQINRTKTELVTWKSQVEQQMYSSKLLHALQNLQLISSAPPRSRAVHEAADRVLAVTAKGRSRWSRAILTNRIKMNFIKSRHKRVRRAKGLVTWNRGLKKSGMRGGVQRRVRVLSRLVPGCREEEMGVVLEEAGDYIAALQMQVRAMAALADLLSGHPPL